MNRVASLFMMKLFIVVLAELVPPITKPTVKPDIVIFMIDCSSFEYPFSLKNKIIITNHYNKNFIYAIEVKKLLYLDMYTYSRENIFFTLSQPNSSSSGFIIVFAGLSY